jgi:hypothetical protein
MIVVFENAFAASVCQLTDETKMAASNHIWIRGIAFNGKEPPSPVIIIYDETAILERVLYSENVIKNK